MKVSGNDALDFIFNSVLKLCAFYLQTCFCECKIELCIPYEVAFNAFFMYVYFVCWLLCTRTAFLSSCMYSWNFKPSEILGNAVHSKFFMQRSTTQRWLLYQKLQQPTKKPQFPQFVILNDFHNIRKLRL